MAEGVTARCGTKRKSFERGDADILLGPNKKCQSPVVFTAPDGRTSTKTKSRLSLFATNASHGNDQINQQFISRINQAETLLNTKRVSSSRDSLLGTICKSEFTTPRKFNLNPGGTTPNPSSFMTPMNTGRRDSLCGRTPFHSERPVTQQKCRVPMSGRKMKMRASVQLRMVESQELQASRVARAKREMWMDRQERAYSVWLNQLLKQPMDANSKVLSAGSGAEIQSSVESLGRLSGSFGVGIGSISYDSRERRFSREVLSDLHQKPKPYEKQYRKILSNSQLSTARLFRGLKEYKRTNPDEPETHLSQVCTASELRRRLFPYLAPSKSDRVISTMTQLAKNVDDGRLRMKPNCIILSDVALRKKALDVLFSYTPAWLRLGLVVVLGPIALSDEKSLALNMAGGDGGDIDISFLEVLIEEHFFADSVLSKSFAANRLIDGLYRDGYKEALGKLILKRIFLLILVLDKMKCETALDSAHGIDGLDGGSPLLFKADAKVKSSRQALEDFLSNVMQGEGDLIIHVGKLGYHVSHIQAPLCEYNFEVVNLVEDLQDGIRLCRLAQLMSRDVSVLVNVRLPCHMPKKRVHNCEMALQSLALAGVPLLDDQESPIIAEHIAAGQREKTLSLMWNVILHLQLPRLVSHPKFWQEIKFSPGKIAMGPLQLETEGCAVLDLLLTWVQAICSNFGAATVKNFSTCFADGRVLCYLISNYLPHCIPHHAIRSTMCSASNLVQSSGQHGRWKLPTHQMTEYITLDDREAIAHNFGMVKDVIKMFGNLPEVLELSDFVGGDLCTSERNIIIFVAHLCSGLLNADPQKFHAVDVMNPTFAKAESKWGKPIPSHGDSVDSDPVGYDAIHDCAAVQIQACYKGRLQRRAFKSLKRSVTVLQRFIREWLAKKKTIHIYQMLSKSEEKTEAVVVLADDREEGNHEIILKHVRTLQRWIRTRQLRKTFLLQNQAACTIQVRWRECLQMSVAKGREAACTKQRQSGGIRSKAACTIQKFVRGSLVHKRFRVAREAVLKIQAGWRGHCLIRDVKRREIAARRQYHLQKEGITRVQAIVRGHQVRKRVENMQKAVLTIQARWRGRSVRIRIQRWGVAATRIQSHYWGYCQRKQYVESMKGILQFQALVRGNMVRRKFKVLREAVFLIQSYWRLSCARNNQRTLAAVRIQRHLRGILQRRESYSCMDGVRRLQAVVRGSLVRKRLRISRGAVLKIQVTWRGHCVRRDMKAERVAAIQVQRYFRGYCRRRDFHACKTSTVYIQATVRGHLVRQRFQCLREGVLKIQSVWRGICVRRMTKSWKLAATQIERCYFTFCQRNLYKSQISAIVHAQAIVRGNLRRRSFIVLRRAVVRFQACWRGFRTRMMIQKMGAAVTQIQSLYRGYCSRKSYNLSKSWVLKVQALARRFLIRRRMDTCRTAVIVIQASWRAHVERGAFLKWKKAAIEMQSYYRGYYQRKTFSLQKSFIVRLQAVVRGTLTRKRITSIKQAALTIQAWWRGFCARRNLQYSRDAAKRIQSSYRGYVQRKLYHKETTAVVTVQAIVRRELVRQRVSQFNQAALTIQAVWRGSHVRKLVQIWRSSATKIQSCFRGSVQRRTYRSFLQAVVTIQAVSRGGLHRKLSHMKMQKDHYRLAYQPDHCSQTAASIIQAHWRSHCVRKHYPTLSTERTAEQYETDRDLTEVESSGRVYNMFELEAVRTITLWVTAQKDRFKFLRLRRLAILIQQRFRGQKARNHYAHVKRSVALIQAHWRGHKWRKGQGRVKQHMQDLRLRMQCTAATVDNSQRLGNRLLKALAHLLSQKTVSGILNTCATIDMATEHSKQCCEWLAEGGAICKLLQLIQTTNRSPPHEQVLKHALSILANLARYPNLAFRIASEPDSISIINEQLLVFRNKEEVFSKAMKVLQHVCATPGCNDIIQKDAVVIRRLQHVAQMLERKFEVEKRNLEKLPQSAHLPIRIAADQKLRETFLHHQSIATILPGLVGGKLTLNTGTQRPSGVVRSIAHGLASQKDNISSNFAISKTSDSRRDSISSATSQTKPLEERRRESLKSTIPLANTTHDRRRESISSKPPWGKASLQVGKAVRQTPRLGIEKRKEYITSTTSGLSDNRRQENITSMTSKAKVIKGRTESTSNRPHWGKATLQPCKVSSEVRISQSRLPPVPFRDRSNHVT